MLHMNAKDMNIAEKDQMRRIMLPENPATNTRFLPESYKPNKKLKYLNKY